jgi:hypothetical protein
VIETLIFAAVSTLLYRLGLGPLLFLIPLQVVYIRRGKKSFAAACALSLLLILVAGLLLARRWTLGSGDASQTGLPVAAPFLLLDLVVAATLIGALALIQLPEMGVDLGGFRAPKITRIIIATGIAGLISLPVILYLRDSEVFSAGVREFIGVRLDLMNSAVAAQPETLLPGVQPIEIQELLQFITTIALRSFLFYFFLILTFGWWLGTIIGSRSTGTRARITPVADFKLPDRYVWPLIASLALVVLTLIFPIGFLQIVGWNFLLILVFLYGVAGLGIIRFLLKKMKVRPGIRWLLIIGIVILAMTPRVGIAVLILIPGLGVSEIWLKYRREERSSV